MKNIKLFEEFSEIRKWKIFSGLGGGFGGAHYIKNFTGTEEAAEKEAWLAAIEEYESYEGLHGLRTVDEIMNEDGVDEEEAQEIYNEEREGWLDYYVKPDDGVRESVSDAQKQLDDFTYKEDKVKSSFIPKKKVQDWVKRLETKYPLLRIRIQYGSNDTLVAGAEIKR